MLSCCSSQTDESFEPAAASSSAPVRCRARAAEGPTAAAAADAAAPAALRVVTAALQQGRPQPLRIMSMLRTHCILASTLSTTADMSFFAYRPRPHTHTQAGFNGGHADSDPQADRPPPRRTKPPELPGGSLPPRPQGLRPAGPARARLGPCWCTLAQSDARAARAGAAPARGRGGGRGFPAAGTPAPGAPSFRVRRGRAVAARLTRAE